MPAVGRGRSPGPRMATVGAWPVSWAPYGRRGGVASPLGPVCLPWGRGRSPGPRMAAMEAWPVDWIPYVCRGGVAAMGKWPVPWVPYGRRGGVTVPLRPAWLS